MGLILRVKVAKHMPVWEKHRDPTLEIHAHADNRRAKSDAAPKIESA